jgi:UDP-N-acetylmuramoyl-tripeptide--D-alanyl-D-alanine ligase
MKDRLKSWVVKILTKESELVLNKFKPRVIAITGNVGKTTTKDFVYCVLRSAGNVRAAEKSQNSEFGVCLTILGEKNAWNNPAAWFKLLTAGFLKEYLGNLAGKKYPKKLILEVGADHSGDIKHITSFVKPDVVVLTAFQKTPTHGEFFQTIEQHIREKKYLVDAIKTGGTIVYNADDEVMNKMARSVEGLKDVKLISFGKSEGANVRISDSKNIYDSEQEVLGTRMKLSVVGETLEVDLIGVLGEAQNYSLAAAVAVGMTEGLDLQIMGDSIKNNFAPTPSRMRILRGINGSKLLDDSYNASPVAVENAVTVLQNTFVKGKKIVVLGHMAELGDKTRDSHIEQAKNIASVADVIIFSGRYNEYYLEGVRQAKFPAEKIFLAGNAREVNKIIAENNLLKENDLLFVKGSQSARLENVASCCS